MEGRVWKLTVLTLTWKKLAIRRGEKRSNEFEKINKKTLFDEGFSACLEVLLSNMQTESKPKGVIVHRRLNF